MKQEEILVKLVEGKDGQKWANDAYVWSLDGKGTSSLMALLLAHSLTRDI